MDRGGGEIYRILPPIPGDADLNGMVTIDDLGNLASNWQRTGDAMWAHGDFNDDGNVTISDLGELASHWQQSVPGPTFEEDAGDVRPADERARTGRSGS